MSNASKVEWIPMNPARETLPAPKRHIIVSALRVAALQYAIDARLTAEIPRLQKAFLAQAKEANDLADELE